MDERRNSERIDAYQVGLAAVNDVDAQLDLERDFQRRAGRSPDYKEGVAAFLEKRNAIFSGREE